jgi:CRP-like cAMP-binding protein
MKELDIEPGQVVFSQGDQNPNLYFVQRGVLTLSFNHPKEEKQVVLKELEVGSVANTAAFFLSTICTFSLKAKTESKIKYLEKDILLKWKKEFPRLVSELNRFCMTKEDISGLVKKREQNQRDHERLKVSLKAEVQYLDHMGKPFGKKLRVMLSDISEGGGCYEYTITKQEAADRLLENQLIMDIFYQTSAGEQKEIRTGKIVAVNIIPFSKSTIHVQFDKLLNKTVIESIKQTDIKD